jgi:recombination protein RecR
MSSSGAIEALKEALRRLPGVGPKNAQRMAFHLMERDRDGAGEIAAALQSALEKVKSCTRCNTFCESELCDLCVSSKRDATILCVVETPADLEAIEQSGAYSGMYFVLMGQLSPIDGVGPDKLGFDRLNKLITGELITEVIIATNLTAEGEATAEYLRQLTEAIDVRTTRLARGVPIGGELEYMDQRTVSQAFKDRRELG